MTIGFALEYIPRRMEELGHGDNYLMYFRHLQVDPETTRTLISDNQIYFLVEEPEDVTVKSQFGEFNLSDTAIDEMYYEHHGPLEIINHSTDHQLIKFIQVIPRHSQKGK